MDSNTVIRRLTQIRNRWTEDLEHLGALLTNLEADGLTPSSEGEGPALSPMYLDDSGQWKSRASSAAEATASSPPRMAQATWEFWKSLILEHGQRLEALEAWRREQEASRSRDELICPQCHWQDQESAFTRVGPPTSCPPSPPSPSAKAQATQRISPLTVRTGD